MMKSYTKKIKAGLMTLLLGLSPTIYGQYCTPTYSTGCSSGDDLNDVQLDGLSVSLSNLNSGCNGNYSDNTSMNAPDLSAGLTYTLKVGTSYSSPQSESVKVWIDYDENDTFDPSEEVGSISGMSAGLNSIDFTVPATTTLGVKRMRVKLDYTTDASTITACGSATWGETEDYSVEIIAPPSCLPPQNLMVSNGTPTSIDFGWTEMNSASEWEVEFGAEGFALGNGTSAIATNNPYTATITSGNEYDFYVRSICSVGDTSAWAGPFNFGYCEVSTSYSGDRLSGVNSSGAESDISYSAASQPVGSYADETAQTFESYESQSFTITTDYVGGPNGVNIWIDWNNDMNFDPSELVASQADNSASKAFSITIPIGTAVGDYRMRVRGEYGSTANPPACGNVNYGSTVDFNLAIISPPSCLSPTDLLTTNTTSTSVDLGWQENNGATTWNIEWGTVGFTQGGANGNLETGVTSNPYTIAIQPNSTYEFYVQTDCGGGDLSSWAGPYEFTNEYCFPSYSYTSEYLSVIETNGALNDVSHTAAAFPTPNGYTDETAQVIQAYETLSFDLNTVYNPSSFGYVTRMWVDWNNDFVFDHATEMLSSASGTGSISQQITIPTGTQPGTYRVRVRGQYGTGSNPMPCSNESWGSAADFTLEIVQAPSCLPPMDIDTVSVSQTSVELSWNELNTNVSNWMIEYGSAGFVPGNGTEVNATSNPFTISGLSPSTNYEFYVRSDCGGGDTSYWRGPYSVYTDCGIAIAPFYEGFNNGVQPQCWENISSDPSSSTNNFWLFDAQGDYESANNGKAAGTFTKSDASTPNPDSMMLITPEIDISQLTTPYLSFEWYSNNGNYPGDNVPFIIELFDGTSWHLLDTLQGDNPEWQFVNYDLSAYVGNNIQIRFMTNQTTTTNYAYYNDILLDEVRVDDCITLGGQDGTVDVCRLDGEINLDDNIITKPNGTGIWSFPNEPNYLVDDTIFNYSLLPAGTHEVYYVERYVCYDTTVATINVFDASSAGLDGADTVCKNEPIDLYGTLGGNADFGGDWYDFTNTLLPNSQPKAQAIPGEYNYVYIADNGVCPADTAVVTISVKGDCDWLSVGDEILKELSVYPNPATSQLNIVNPSNASSLKIEMLDMNGRTVLVENKALNNASEATLAIEHLEKGVYTLRVYNEEGQKTFKVVKQ